MIGEVACCLYGIESRSEVLDAAGYDHMFDVAQAMNRIRQEIPSGAKMQNYSVVNWYAYSGGYPSWGSENGVSVDYSTMPPVGAIHDAHSMDSYAFCEMANAILSQTNSQFFNSCGPTAVLAALTARSPVQAFKKA